jgi:hypothetical protein
MGSLQNGVTCFLSDLGGHNGRPMHTSKECVGQVRRRLFVSGASFQLHKNINNNNNNNNNNNSNSNNNNNNNNNKMIKMIKITII